MQYHDRVGLYCCHFLNQFILAVRHTHMLSVKALRFKSIRKPRENNCHFCFLSCLHCLRKQLLICLILFIIKAHGKGNITHSPNRIQSRSDLMTVDMGAAATLITGLHGIFTDKSYLILFRQRKNTVIFQKNNGFLCNLTSQFMILIPVKNRTLITILLITEYNI